MDDFLGNKLEVGDIILITADIGTNHLTFVEATITRFTPTMLEYVTEGKPQWRSNSKTVPSKVIKMPVVGEVYGE